jgi:hypothetical protein
MGGELIAIAAFVLFTGVSVWAGLRLRGNRIPF